MSFSGSVFTSDLFQNLLYPPCFPLEKSELPSVQWFRFDHPRIVEYYDRYGAKLFQPWEKVVIVAKAFFLLCAIYPAACLGVVYHGIKTAFSQHHFEALKQDIKMSLPALAALALYRIVPYGSVAILAIDLLYAATSFTSSRFSTFLARVVPSGTEFHWMFSLLFRRTLGLTGLAVPPEAIEGELAEKYRKAGCRIEKDLIWEVVVVYDEVKTMEGSEELLKAFTYSGEAWNGFTLAAAIEKFNPAMTEESAPFRELQKRLDFYNGCMDEMVEWGLGVRRAAHSSSLLGSGYVPALLEISGVEVAKLGERIAKERSTPGSLADKISRLRLGILILAGAIASVSKQEFQPESWHAGKIGFQLGITQGSVFKGDMCYSGIGLAFACCGMGDIQKTVDHFVYKKIREKCPVLTENYDRDFLEFFLDDAGIVLHTEEEFAAAIAKSKDLMSKWINTYKEESKETLLKAVKEYRPSDVLLAKFVESKKLDPQSAKLICLLTSYATLEEEAITNPLAILSLVLQFSAFEFDGKIGVRQLLFCLHPDRQNRNDSVEMQNFIKHLWSIVDALKAFEIPLNYDKS